MEDEANLRVDSISLIVFTKIWIFKRSWTFTYTSTIHSHSHSDTFIIENFLTDFTSPSLSSFDSTISKTQPFRTARAPVMNVFVFFVRLSFSLRLATHLCSLRITVCQNSRVQKEQRVDRSQGERQHDQRKRNADWKSAATLREGASARKLGLCENNTNHERDATVQRALSHYRHGGIIFFPPYSSKYVDYIWWSSRRLRFNSRQLSRNIQTYLLLFDRILDTKLRIS